MAYILGLFLILGLVFYSAGQFGFSGDILGNITDTVRGAFDSAKSKLYSTIFPKSEREILIENLESNNNFLDKFFSDTAPEILKSKGISDKDKEVIRQAITKFSETKKSIQTIKATENQDNGILKTLVDKIFKVDPSLGPNPTSIPPQCRLECN